jgi:cobyrinic acid a,c-diamide synthase
MTRVMIAAPSSGAGKTTVTLALMRILRREGISFQPAKSGPDYIDPRFHEVAAGCTSLNLDAWAMPLSQIKNLSGPGNLIVEGSMGLFDGAGLAGKGSAADLANMLSLPVILVIDAAKTAHSVAAMVQGFARFDPRVTVAAVIFNRVGSPRHLQMLQAALSGSGIPIFAHLLRSENYALPERHLGLVQASENRDLDGWIDRVADALSMSLDLPALCALTGEAVKTEFIPTPPPAQHIAIARDLAFEFSYPHQLRGWQEAGASLSFFSPLADEAAPKDSGYIFLPGGYPELHAPQLAAAQKFKASMARYAATGSAIYGECGGYMVLGRGLVDAKGGRHEMLGLLPLETSFQTPKLHLGYRQLTPLSDHFTGALGAHEFHYATTLTADGPPLFAAEDADGAFLGNMGLHIGQTCGSFAHIITGP